MRLVWREQVLAPPVAPGHSTVQTLSVLEPITVLCQECSRELGAKSPDLRVELTDDDQLVVYCEECFEREFR
jgi:hypothetical protein